MRSFIRFVPAQALLVVALSGCGGGSDTNFDRGTGGSSSGSGGGASADSGAGGSTTGSGGQGTSGGGSGGGGGANGTDSGAGGGSGSGGSGANTGGGSGSGGTTGAGGTGSGGTPDAGPTTCGGLTCDAAAACDTSGASPKCVCPSGYDDPNGNGTVCTKQNTQKCTDGTECTSGNCVGGTCCAVACDTPGICERLQGTVCVGGTTCQYGLEVDSTPCDDGDSCTNTSCFNGTCTIDSTKDCNDNDPCTTDGCNAGACTHDPVDCDDGNPCTTDSCGAANGCQHIDNTAACDDGDPCTTDSCSGGLCVGIPKDCSSLDTDCKVGVCVSGTCQAQNTNLNNACTGPGLDACDKTATCNASGVCVGKNDACGKIGTVASACTPGTGGAHTCTCMTGYIVVNGVCVLDTNECNANPCDPIAIACNDPSTASGDVQCTCPPGYTGTGIGAGGCVDINECTSGDPCGVGKKATGGCVNTAGSYTCSCKAGFRSVSTPTGPICACDITGSYAMVSESNLTWSAVAGAIEASPPGGVAGYSWSLRYQTLQANGSLKVQSIPCGGAPPALCDTTFQFAHGQYQQNSVWGKPKTYSSFPVVTVSSIASVVPGGSYTEPQTAALMGISLANPAGEWPPCRACVGVAAGGTCTCADGQHTITNVAQWVDADADTKTGITTVDVPRGGSTNATAPFDYSEPSECPRIATPHATYGYSEWPGIVGISFFRTYQWYGASRIISQVQSTSISSTCGITGSIVGPDAGNRPHADARVAGCETCDTSVINSCSPGNTCTTAQTDSYDSVTQSQQVNSVNFVLHKVAAVGAGGALDLGPILAMADGPTKEAAINNACTQVRQTYCNTDFATSPTYSAKNCGP